MFTVINDTLSLIPQRPPFVMIDTLLYSDEVVSCSTFRVREDNIFIEKGQLLEAALVENIAQTAAARAGYSSRINNQPVAIGYIGAVNNFVVHSLPLVDDELQTEVTVVNQVFDVTIISGKVRCNNELVASCDMKIFITPSK